MKCFIIDWLKQLLTKDEDMKVDALAAQAVADGVLYDVGFADGVASVGGDPVTGVTPEQEKMDIDQAVSAAVAPLNDAIAALNLAKTAEDTLLASVKSAAAALAALMG